MYHGQECILRQQVFRKSWFAQAQDTSHHVSVLGS